MEKSMEPQRFSTARAQPITERDRKINFFCGHVIEANNSDELLRCIIQFGFTSPTALSKELGLGKRLTETKDGCTIATQDTLAKYFGFDRTWPEWINGTAYAFALRYNKENIYERHHSELPTLPTRQLGLRLRSERIPLELKDEQPKLASIDLFLNQPNAGQPWPVSFDLICQPAPVRNFEIAVKRGLIELSAGSATLPGSRQRLGGNGPVSFALKNPDREITIEVANGAAGRPAWDVSCRGKPIGVFRLDEEQSLCGAEALAPGDEVTLSFKAYVGDLVLVDGDLDDDEDDAYETGPRASFLRPDGKPLSPVKRALIKALLVKNELSVDANGFVEVAADRRAFFEDGGND